MFHQTFLYFTYIFEKLLYDVGDDELSLIEIHHNEMKLFNQLNQEMLQTTPTAITILTRHHDP